jgi:hypothetical protein
MFSQTPRLQRSTKKRNTPMGTPQMRSLKYSESPSNPEKAIYLLQTDTVSIQQGSFPPAIQSFLG